MHEATYEEILLSAFEKCSGDLLLRVLVLLQHRLRLERHNVEFGLSDRLPVASDCAEKMCDFVLKCRGAQPGLREP